MLCVPRSRSYIHCCASDGDRLLSSSTECPYTSSYPSYSIQKTRTNHGQKKISNGPMTNLFLNVYEGYYTNHLNSSYLSLDDVATFLLDFVITFSLISRLQI